MNASNQSNQINSKNSCATIFMIGIRSKWRSAFSLLSDSLVRSSILRLSQIYLPPRSILNVGALRRSNCLLLRREFASIDSNDTHDDFKAKHKQEGTADATAMIKSDITSNDVFLYMKGVPDAPSCGFSNMACRYANLEAVHFLPTILVSSVSLQFSFVFVFRVLDAYGKSKVLM